MTCDIMALELALIEELYLPVTDNRYILRGSICPNQTGHHKFEVQQDPNPASFMLVYGSKAICLSVFPALHTFVHYQVNAKKKLSKLFCTE